MNKDSKRAADPFIEDQWVSQTEVALNQTSEKKRVRLQRPQAWDLECVT